MYFTTALTALALALATSVHAAPGSPIAERQATPTIYVRFYNGGGCQGDWQEDTVFVQDGSGACVPNTITQKYGSFRVEGNTATKTLNVFTRSDCTTQSGGNTLPIAPGFIGCKSQQVGSSQFSS
ncbi:hypothetical protein EJ04DRAFT_508841 [Polyplosphaeria fusca]|uniref:Uncharacterized protein n=1 Tax=Polyplosphaeria fusca TaxID=682080 RepID=A0A9P4V8J7_9PLEO|nr:hypothetical protein EJ04DRAFT_508841 [Polyplosphaeria fusca]